MRGLLLQLGLTDDRSSMSNENENRQSQIKPPFCRAARFNSGAESRESYLIAEHAIAGAMADISVYRLQIRRIWHVAAISDIMPPADLQQSIEDAINMGKRAELPIEVLTLLLNRHRQVMRHRLPWVEGHYHPGKVMPLED